MTALFADTFYWIALADFTDSAHHRALAITAEWPASPMVTTDEALAEHLTFFSTAPAQLRSGAAASVQGILANPATRVIPQSRDSFIPGPQRYTQRPDKRNRLTGCISMQTMRREGLTVALANDRHSEQEGFRALFRDP